MVYRMLLSPIFSATSSKPIPAKGWPQPARKGTRKPKLSATQVTDAQAQYDSRAWTVQQNAGPYDVRTPPATPAHPPFMP